MPTTPRSMVLVTVAIVAVVAVAFVASAGEPSIEHLPTPTAQELEDRSKRDFDALPEHDKLRVSEDVGVFYLHCDPAGTYDPISTLLIFHFPSDSWYSPVSLGPSKSQTRYESTEGMRALEAVRADEELMETILERSPKPARCPEGLARGLPDFMENWAAHDYMEIDDDIVVNFNECDGHVEYDGIFTLYHRPSWSSIDVEVEPGTFESGLRNIEFVASPTAKRRLLEVLSDEPLIAELRAASDRSVRCPAPEQLEQVNGATN